MTNARLTSSKKRMCPAICDIFSEFGLAKIKNIPLSRKVANAISAFHQGNNGMFLFWGEC